MFCGDYHDGGKACKAKEFLGNERRISREMTREQGCGSEYTYLRSINTALVAHIGALLGLHFLFK